MKVKTIYWCLILALFSCTSEKKYYALIETAYGDITVELYNSTPHHRDNFVKLVKENFYDDLLFHRVIKDFMVQGGDPDSKNAPQGQRLGMGGPGYRIPNEIGAPHFKGTLAAARTGGPSNPNKESSGSQFYLVQGTKQSRATLEAMARSKGFQYNEAQIKKYEEVGGTPFLDGDYTVFGEVTAGMEVIDKIAEVQTDNADRPIEDIKMKIRMVR